MKHLRSSVVCGYSGAGMIIGKDDIGRFQKCPICNGAGKRPRVRSDS